MEHLAEIAQMRATWTASLTEEQRAAIATQKATMATEEGKAEMMAEMIATFQTNDTNSNGVID